MSNDNDNQELIELLSAYLDKELSEHQQEKISQLIAADAQVRAQYESLLMVSRKVSSLPKQKLPRDLTDDVLYDLERETLLDGNNDPSLMAGERHLRIRNFVGAAIILLLVSAVFVAIYSILKPGQISQPEQTLAKVMDQEPESSLSPSIAMSEERGKRVTGQPAIKGQDEVVVLNSIKDAARFLGVPDNDQPGTIQAEEAIAEPQAIASIVKEFSFKPMSLPVASYSNIKLVTKIDKSDSFTLEKLRYLANRYQGEFFSSGQTHILALVCRSEDFGDIYFNIRENLPGMVDMQLGETDKYESVTIQNIATAEIFPLVKLKETSARLEYALSVLPSERILTEKKEYKPEPPLWEQMSILAPLAHQAEVGRQYRMILEPYMPGSDDQLELLLAQADEVATSAAESKAGKEQLQETQLQANTNQPAQIASVLTKESDDNVVQCTVDYVALEIVIGNIEAPATPAIEPAPSSSNSRQAPAPQPVEGRIQFGPMLH
ncbi:MAG: hypothetical protein JXM68_05190 [Sedimentisphaerales bacterium]|nr:hypothetical protein [Sedimentisphaerales bacterium]